jgi:hypothetical protein
MDWTFTIWSLVVTICTTSLTFNNSTFCPHTVFMCFVWIWEQTAIISLYSINWLVFVTETECVYCVVWTGSLNTIHDGLFLCMVRYWSIPKYCATKPGHQVNVATNSVFWAQIFLCSQHWTCVMSPFWRLEFCGGSQMYGKFVYHGFWVCCQRIERLLP